jgi:hypothetical protein
MIEIDTPSRPDARQGTPLLTAVVSRLPLFAMVACIVAAFGSHALGSKKQRPTDKRETLKTLVATEGVEHLDRLAREPMVVELSDGTLFMSGYDNNAEQSPGLWRSRDHGATWESVNVGASSPLAGIFPELGHGRHQPACPLS